MKRRQFITLIGGVAVWPAATRAQQQRMRRVGVLVGGGANDPEWQARIAGLRDVLHEFGWLESNNIRFEVRFAEGKPERLTALATELADAKPDLIVVSGSPATNAVRKVTQTIPIVMVAVGDAVGAGFVASMARPGGNITGQTHVATEQGTKRLELLKEINPGLDRVAVLWNGNNAGHRLQFNELERVAPIALVGLQSVPINDASELQPGLHAAAAAGAQALMTMDDSLIGALRGRIIEFSMRFKLPVMGEFKLTPVAGGLVSYGPNQVDLWRLIGTHHVDKILRGARPGDLPVHQPTKFELVINLKTAKTLGLEIPATLLARADEVIE